MKTSIYLTDPKIKAAVKDIGKTSDIGVTFAKVDNQFNLKHDDLARAMYVAIEAGTNDPENVKTLLSHDEEKMLKEAYMSGEIGIEYLKRWMTEKELEAIQAAKANADAAKG